MLATHPARRERCRAAGSDRRLFLRAWAADPLRVAAIAPSGTALARLMLADIGQGHGPVLELGPGTGIFTQALLDRGVDPADLTLVEIDAHFAARLAARFPGVRVVEGDASRIAPHRLFPRERAGAVVSGLGLLSMPPGTVLRILARAFACLRPGAAFHQFTYGPGCPVPASVLERLGLEARRTGGTWRNLPPASVYRIGRRADAGHDFQATPQPDRSEVRR